MTWLRRECTVCGGRIVYALAHSSFYSPNVTLGACSFATVKVIDIMWDLVVGKIGQILLGLIPHRVWMDTLLLIIILIWFLIHHMSRLEYLALVPCLQLTIPSLS